MGQSGGRSARARVDPAARRRATPRERQQIDPPWDQRVPQYRLTTRGERVKQWLDSAFVYGICIALGLGGGLLLGAWLL